MTDEQKLAIQTNLEAIVIEKPKQKKRKKKQMNTVNIYFILFSTSNKE